MNTLTDTLPVLAQQEIPLEQFLSANWHMDWCAARDAQEAAAERARGGWLQPYDWRDDDPEYQERRRQETNRRHAAWDAEARRIVAGLPPGPKRVVLYKARWWIICAGAPQHGPYILPPGAPQLEGR